MAGNVRLRSALILESIARRGADLAFMLEGRLGRIADARERALLRFLCYGVLRNYQGLQIFSQIIPPQAASQKEPKTQKIHGRGGRIAKLLIMIGALQLHATRMPKYAALASVLEAAEQSPAAGLKPLIHRALTEAQNKPYPILGPYLPETVLAGWQNRFGAEQSQKICQALALEPACYVSFRSEKEQREICHSFFTPLFAESARCESARAMRTLPGYKSGKWWVQDIAARLPVELLCAHIKDTMRSTHACEALEIGAVPGGKSAQLAARGVKLTAIDRKNSPLFSENMRRLGFSVSKITADMRFVRLNRKWRFILLDAPCSATGILRRRPDLGFRHSQKKMQKLTQLQHALLCAAWRHIEEGGVLVYAVCSLEAAEGPERIAQFLRLTPSASQLPIKTLPEAYKDALCQDGFVQTLPHHGLEYGGMDGFFCAVLKRNKAR